jgi:thiol-disulfide isomerase/thioredoxin
MPTMPQPQFRPLCCALILIARAVAAPHDDPVAVCSQRLAKIHKALLAYEQKHHEWPDHLSDLVPEYLPDREALRDPADSGRGDLGSDQGHPDPKFPVSYSYERNADVSNGLAQPLGRFPKPDIPDTGWGSWRLVNGRMEYFFGDQVPVVRCYHHRPVEDEREPGHDLVLNLTPSGRIYTSDYEWRHHPDSVAFLLRTLDRDLTQGAAHVGRTWLLWRVNEFFGDVAEISPKVRGVAESVAKGLLDQHRNFPDGQRAACQLSARISLALGQAEPTLAALEAGRMLPGAEWSPIVEDQIRARVYHAAKRYDKEIDTYLSLLKGRPGVRPYMEGLARAYELSGQPGKAREWREKADPGQQLVGRPAPDFRLTLLDGSTRTLDDLRRDHKATLVNFWFCGCDPCRLEFPYLDELYRDLGVRGLIVVAVNFNDTPERIAKFVSSARATFPIALGRHGERENPIFHDYHVESYPTSYLIGADGKVVWRGVGYGRELRRELPERLKQLGLGR